MAQDNPYITGEHNPVYTANKQGFGHCLIGFPYYKQHTLGTTTHVATKMVHSGYIQWSLH